MGPLEIDLLPSAPYRASHLTSTCSLGFSLDPQAGVHAIATDVRSAFRVRANSFAWLPDRCDVFSSSDRGGEYLLISTPDPIGGDRWQTDILDPASSPMAKQLRAALILGGDDLELEHFATALLDRFADIQSNRTVSPASWMTEKRLRRVDELIAAGLGGSILVADLSRELGLSTGYFSRAFRAATGRSPQFHIINFRIRRARAMIRSTNLPLTTIALTCGFSSHAHMSTQFRRWLGVAPSQLRAEKPNKFSAVLAGNVALPPK